jgi:hypothetical protein
MEHTNVPEIAEEMPTQPTFSFPLFLLVFWLTTVATGMITWQMLN